MPTVTDSTRSDGFLISARELMQDGCLDEAISHYSKAVESRMMEAGGDVFPELAVILMEYAYVID